MNIKLFIYNDLITKKNNNKHITIGKLLMFCKRSNVKIINKINRRICVIYNLIYGRF